MRTEQFLKNMNVEYSLKEYDIDEKDINKVAKEIGLEVDNMVKTLLLKDADNKYIIVLVSIIEKVDMNIINKQLSGKYSLAKYDEVKRVTGYEVGTVSPVLVDKNIKIYIDEKLLNKKIGIATGERGKEFIINVTDLKNAVNAITVKLN